ASRGAASEAARWARHATRLDPDDERSLQRLVRLLDSQGDRAGALRAYTEFAHSLAIEFAAEPSAETQALIDAVRNRTEASGSSIAQPQSQERKTSADDAAVAPLNAGLHGAVAAPVMRPATNHDSIAVSGMQRTFDRWGAYLVLPLIIIVAVAALTTRYLRQPNGPIHASPTVAVGWIQDPSGADTSAATRTFAELLATDLARVPGMHVVSRARLYDMLGQ